MKNIVLLGTRVKQAGQVSKVTVLLADDHPHFPQLVRSLLQETFVILGSVADGKALVEAALELKPDVIVTDISMPVLNGMEAVEQLKRAGCNSKIIFLTIHTGADFVRSCLELGAAGYVVKPKVATELVPAIREVLAGRIFVSPQASRNGPG
jgi:DNA-binding NarL/FixJ family response regulator